MSRRVVLSTLSSLLLTVVVACSDDQSSSTTSAAADTSASADTSAPPADSTVPDTEPAAQASNCQVSITGDLEAEFESNTSDGGTAVTYRSWRIAAGVELAPDVLDGHLSISCWSGEYYISVLSWVPAVDGVELFPTAPATYTIYDGFCSDDWCTDPPADSLALSGFTLGPESWQAGSNGELVITEFDEQHIAGSFTIELATSDPANAQIKTDKRAQLTVQFEFANPY